jgi:hypothetical protein
MHGDDVGMVETGQDASFGQIHLDVGSAAESIGARLLQSDLSSQFHIFRQPHGAEGAFT